MAFTLREVARRAGVSHNAPYRHFRDKDDLMTAVAIEGYRELTEAMEKATRDRDGALDRLKRAGLGVHRVCPAPAGACRGDVRRALEGAETPGIEPGSKASIFGAGRPGGRCGGVARTGGRRSPGICVPGVDHGARRGEAGNYWAAAVSNQGGDIEICVVCNRSVAASKTVSADSTAEIQRVPFLRSITRSIQSSGGVTSDPQLSHRHRLRSAL
jgi:hypothetical protein